MTAKLFFRTRNCCIVRIPDNMPKEQIIDFFIDKIACNDLENWIEAGIDFEIEDFELEE